ncbi:hypothetical protein PO124_16755 [Bacillus licheniformis]|nr:hypothetical protein [Bacillus licheniformis]
MIIETKKNAFPKRLAASKHPSSLHIEGRKPRCRTNQKALRIALKTAPW